MPYRSAIGGAINIVTHTPGTESKVVGYMTVGQYNRLDIQMTADMPINDRILTTLSASSQTQRGYQKIVPYPPDPSIGRNAYPVASTAAMPMEAMTRARIPNPPSSIDTRMARRAVSVTPNRPTSGWMRRKYSARSTMMPPR